MSILLDITYWGYLFTCFWIFGCGFGLVLWRKSQLPLFFLSTLGLFTSCLAGYLCFWSYFFHPFFGRVVSHLLFWSNLAVFFYTVTNDQQVKQAVRSRECWAPLLVMFFVVCFYSCLLFSYPIEPQERFTWMLPPITLFLSSLPIIFTVEQTRGI